MGCNCKKPLENAAKYSEEGFFDNMGDNILIKILNTIIAIIFGIIMAGIFIIVAIPLIVYAMICKTLNKQPTIILPKKWIKIASLKNKS